LLLISAGTSGNVVRVLSPLVIKRTDLIKGLEIIRRELIRLVKFKA
jgi:4-aminobutyrate aminotransferase-like enzyme